QAGGHSPPYALRPADGGPAVPVVTEGDELCFVAHDVPALGYRTFVPAPMTELKGDTSCRAQASVLENEFLKVTLDPARGGIRSVVDKRTGREWVDQNSSYALGQYLYERFDANQVAAYTKAYVKNRSDWAVAELGKPALPPADKMPYRAISPHCDKIASASSAVSVTATMRSGPTAALSHGVTTKVILYAGEPYLDLEVTLHDKPADDWPEAGWICLPVNIRKPQFRLGRLGGMADPARDFVRGSNHDLQAVNTGITIADPEGRGVGICPLDSPLVSLDRPGLFRYSPDFVPSRPAVFVNLFNNQWTTNFRLWNEGTWTMRIRLWAFARGAGILPSNHRQDADATEKRGQDARDTQGRDALATNLITPSLEARYPLLAGVADGKAGTLPGTRKGLELSARGTLVTAFGPNPDGPGTVLRLWEHAGIRGPCEIRLPAGLNVKEVQPVNLRGVPLGPPLPVEEGVFTANLAAFAPISFIIPSVSKGRL
ncbi:MAG: hypothetical protein M1376_14435, partial [Planctomycetes bacterium]|nr:hypothetical protein [Planctomycetota bacterium]